jgi:ubiquinone/menaquinone biosynthesis C-methylase UbiE
MSFNSALNENLQLLRGNMTELSKTLKGIHAGKVLDVATGSGGFIHFLLDELTGYDEIVGIDSTERGAAAFAEAFKDKPNIRFLQMDATHMDFPDASFDTVCMANSAHHFPEPAVVLAEMKRILRPGGTFILLEMYRDNQAETQMTHVLLHHWWAAVDRVGGVVHNETYRREELVEMVAGLGLSELQFFDLSDLGDDPKNPEILEELNSIFDRYLQRAEEHPDLQAQGETLRRRVQDIGFHSASSLAFVARKK